MTTYGLNDKHADIVKLQRYLNEKLGLDLKPDGVMGKITQSNLKVLQNAFSVTENDSDGPCYGPLTQAKISEFIEKKYLTESDYARAAEKAGIEVNVIKTVTAVEALQFGFYNDGQPITLFERHVFYRELTKKYDKLFADKTVALHSSICDPSAGGYKGGRAELERLQRARLIDADCALLSASYGLFQIMGFNHKQAGYNTVTDYLEAMRKSEDLQLDAFVNYLLNDKDGSLLRSLRNKDFTAFAKEYNGPAYKKNEYDTKMLKVYQSLCSK